MEQKKAKGNGRITTDHFPLKKGYWYILHIKDLLDIHLYPVYFINKESAKRAIQSEIPRNRRNNYQVINYKKLGDYRVAYTIGLGKLAKFSKYGDISKLTPQGKKSLRTKQRRRLRRMDMLIPKKHKIIVGDKVPQARYKKNQQKVANSPGTMARAFRLERKNKAWYYIILSKKRSDKKGIAFRIKAMRYSSKTGELKKLFINIQNQDVVIPYLLTEVLEIAKSKNHEVDKTRKAIIRAAKGKSKEILQRMV